MKRISMLGMVLIGLILGVGIQAKFNVASKEPVVIEKTVEIEKLVEVGVDKIVEVPVEVEKVIYVKPKARCELIVEN